MKKFNDLTPEEKEQAIISRAFDSLQSSIISMYNLRERDKANKECTNEYYAYLLDFIIYVWSLKTGSDKDLPFEFFIPKIVAAG